MQIYSQLVPLALGNANGSAVAMGFFDGIHIGHRAVIEGAVQWARAHGASPAVFTFKLPTENKMKGKRLLSTEDNMPSSNVWAWSIISARILRRSRP